MLISPDVDLTLFVTFITTCKTSSIKFGLCYQQGWLRTWPRWSFANPLWFNMLEHDYQAAKREISYFLYFFITIYSTSDLWCYCISSCCSVLFHDLSHNSAWLNHSIPVALSLACPDCFDSACSHLTDSKRSAFAEIHQTLSFPSEVYLRQLQVSRSVGRLTHEAISVVCSPKFCTLEENSVGTLF